VLGIHHYMDFQKEV